MIAHLFQVYCVNDIGILFLTPYPPRGLQKRRIKKKFNKKMLLSKIACSRHQMHKISIIADELQSNMVIENADYYNLQDKGIILSDPKNKLLT